MEGFLCFVNLLMVKGVSVCSVLNRYWRLCLPVGETSDHPLVNPFGPHSMSLEGTNR